jgi:hypothetical protein
MNMNSNSAMSIRSAPKTLFIVALSADIRPSIDKRGYSVTREEAMADFKARWLRGPRTFSA